MSLVYRRKPLLYIDIKYLIGNGHCCLCLHDYQTFVDVPMIYNVMFWVYWILFFRFYYSIIKKIENVRVFVCSIAICIDTVLLYRLPLREYLLITIQGKPSLHFICVERIEKSSVLYCIGEFKTVLVIKPIKNIILYVDRLFKITVIFNIRLMVVQLFFFFKVIDLMFYFFFVTFVYFFFKFLFLDITFILNIPILIKPTIQ